MPNTNTTLKHADLTIGKFDYSLSDVPSTGGVDCYHHSHGVMFLGNGGRGEVAGGLMYGTETECEHEYAEWDVCNTMADKIRTIYGDTLEVKGDGSLNCGIEIVTQPATLAYHMNKFMFPDLFLMLRNHDFKSHDTETCGLHVHVGRMGLGQDDLSRELAIAKIICIVDKFYDDELLKFSRRNYDELDQWARKNCANLLIGDNREKFLEKARNNPARYDRYHAVNLTRNDTVEFRLFKGTLNVETYFATIQLVDAIVRYAKTHTVQEVVSCTWSDIIKMCKYAELPEYCERKGIGA